MLIVKKCDLESDNNMKFIETSAETEQKVDEPFETLADEIIRFNEEINNNKEEFEKEKKAQRKKSKNIKN